jgi:hypothetical protein
MKKVILSSISVIAFLFLSVVFYSCEDMMGDYLEKAPGVDVTEDTIFSNRNRAETFLFSIYEYGIHSNLSYAGSWEARDREGYANPEATMMDGCSDEAECTTDFYFPQHWNRGAIGPNLHPDDLDGRFELRFKAIRRVTILIDRIDDVPDMTGAEKEQWKAEAKVIRAMNYLEMFKRYGGMPIIDRRLSVDDDLKIPRSSVEDLVDFIVRECDEAIPHLQAFYPGDSNLKGRIHQGVAHAIKSKTLLYAASPLFNTATPYLSLGENNRMICYGNQDIKRWEKAAEAARDALIWAENSGCSLINNPSDVANNYYNSWSVYDNDEIILAEKSQIRTGGWIWPWGEFTRFFPPNKGYGGTSPTLNFVRKYEKRDGTIQTWNNVGVTGYDVQEKMLELDYRFRATVFYNMSYGNVDVPLLKMYQEAIPEIEEEGVQFQNGQTLQLVGAITKCKGGFWLSKNRPPSLGGSNYALVPNSTLYQLNEIYINYAEAMLEAFGSLNVQPAGYTLSGREAINIIRKRSGQPEIQAGSGPYASERELVRNERSIELAFSNHRFWDIRRWMIAEEEGVMQGDMLGIEINLIEPNAEPQPDKGFKYVTKVFEKRTFYRKMYLHPFTTDEVNKGYLVQNPGY